MHDPEAAYRSKGEGVNKQIVSGYHANITESCDPSDEVNLILDVEVVPANICENEGFNTQKNSGFNLHHKYVRKNFTGICNYYMCMQIAHIIEQLFVLCKNQIMQGGKTFKGMWKQLWATLFLLSLELFPHCQKLKLNYRY